MPETTNAAAATAQQNVVDIPSPLQGFQSLEVTFGVFHWVIIGMVVIATFNFLNLVILCCINRNSSMEKAVKKVDENKKKLIKLERETLEIKNLILKAQGMKQETDRQEQIDTSYSETLNQEEFEH